MGEGCVVCGLKKNISENKLKQLLSNIYSNIEYQKRFDWLGKQSLDFYLPEYNIAIEYQGKQHFESIEMFGGDEEFKKTIERDKRKIKLCEENGIKLYHFSFLNKNFFKNVTYHVFNNINNLIKEINK